MRRLQPGAVLTVRAIGGLHVVTLAWDFVEGQEAKREGLLGFAIERSELNARLSAAIDTLTDMQREVLMMHDVEGWKHADIAHLLGLAESTVRVHLLHARRRLRTLLLAVAPDGQQGEAFR